MLPTPEEIERARGMLKFHSKRDEEFCKNLCIGGNFPGSPSCYGVGCGGPCDRIEIDSDLVMIQKLRTEADRLERGWLRAHEKM